MGASRKAKVIRTIDKDRKKGKAKATKALLRAAKARGLISNVKDAKRTLEGKKKATIRPNGKERTRDKKIRVKREQRERRGYSKRQDASEEEEEWESDDEV